MAAMLQRIAAEPPDSPQSDPFETLGHGWRILRNCRLGQQRGGVGLTALIHPRIGVALLDGMPARLPGAEAAFRARLEAARFHAIFPGTLPVAHLRLTRPQQERLGEVLEGAFAGQPALSLPGGDAWVAAVARALTADAPVPQMKPRRFRARRQRRGAGLRRVLGLGVVALLAFLGLLAVLPQYRPVGPAGVAPEGTLAAPGAALAPPEPPVAALAEPPVAAPLPRTWPEPDLPAAPRTTPPETAMPALEAPSGSANPIPPAAPLPPLTAPAAESPRLVEPTQPAASPPPITPPAAASPRLAAPTPRAAPPSPLTPPAAEPPRLAAPTPPAASLPPIAAPATRPPRLAEPEPPTTLLPPIAAPSAAPPWLAPTPPAASLPPIAAPAPRPPRLAEPTSPALSPSAAAGPPTDWPEPGLPPVSRPALPEPAERPARLQPGAETRPAAMAARRPLAPRRGEAEPAPAEPAPLRSPSPPEEPASLPAIAAAPLLPPPVAAPEATAQQCRRILNLVFEGVLLPETELRFFNSSCVRR